MRNAWKYLLIALVSVVAYYGALDYDLVKCDDNRIVKIYDDPVVKNQSYFFEFTQPYLNLYFQNYPPNLY